MLQVPRVHELTVLQCTIRNKTWCVFLKRHIRYNLKGVNTSIRVPICTILLIQCDNTIHSLVHTGTKKNEPQNNCDNTNSSGTHRIYGGRAPEPLLVQCNASNPLHNT